MLLIGASVGATGARDMMSQLNSTTSASYSSTCAPPPPVQHSADSTDVLLRIYGFQAL